jgi:HPt (histidine-containing phosphotransfer) domain-containing protein
VQETVDSFLGDLPLSLARMHQALGDGDAQTLAFEAHSLRGSSAQIGAVQVAALSGELEQRSRSADLAAAANLLAALEREIERAAPLLEQHKI